MLHINAPLLLKIRDGIALNCSMVLSLAAEKDAPQKRLKKEVADAIKSGAQVEQPTDKDYEVYASADTLSFWFIGGTSLAYRVGFEITQEDYNRVEAQLQGLHYRTKDDRKPSDDKPVKKA